VDDQQQPRWRPTGRQLLWTGRIVGVVALLFLLILLIRLGYAYRWTGFGQYKVNGEVQPYKTLWDWLGLLIVPVVLALGGYLFTRSENRRTRHEADRQRAQERELAEQRRQDDMLQAYLDGMSQLLTGERRPLHRAQVGDSLSTVARARTLTVLTRLDSERKQSVLQFLSEEGLIKKARPVVDLSGADLSEVDVRQLINLRGTNLNGVNLSRANLLMAILTEADVSGANLSEANLNGAYLNEVNLYWANLSEANLAGAILSRANAREADLSMADLNGATLLETDLRGANLSMATVSKANLSGADLSMADLSGVNFSKTFLSRWGNWRGANLSDAQGVTDNQLADAVRFLEGATMPNGQKYEEWLKSNGRGEDGENSGPT
jgi:uncharacterized protein YjbI with pentapeptide repeats